MVDQSVDAAEGGWDHTSSLVERLGPVPSPLLPHRCEVLVLRLYLWQFWSWAARRPLAERLPAPTVTELLRALPFGWTPVAFMPVDASGRLEWKSEDVSSVLVSSTAP